MLLVKTKIGQSKIHGIGLFADEFIAKETPVWKFNPAFDLRGGREIIESLSEPAKRWFFEHATQNPKTGLYTLCADDGRFFNHSDNPNTRHVFDGEGNELMDVAAQNIASGEELTADYRVLDMHPYVGEGFETKQVNLTAP